MLVLCFCWVDWKYCVFQGTIGVWIFGEKEKSATDNPAERSKNLQGGLADGKDCDIWKDQTEKLDQGDDFPKDSIIFPPSPFFALCLG